MIIVLKPHPTPEVVEHVLERIAALGLTPHLSQGISRTIIGVIGDEEKLQVQPLQAIPGVEQVVPILKPFKLASREFPGRVRGAGANILRGGAFKPRTSPYSFQGMGTDGLKLLQAAGEQFGMPV